MTDTEKVQKKCQIHELYSLVELKPEQMTGNYYQYLKSNLKKKVENRCNDIGYIKNVIRLIEYTDNTINIENFSGNSVFKIKYSAEMIIPNVNDVVVLRVKMMGPQLIILTDGSMKFNCQVYKINPEIIIEENGIISNIKANKPLEIGDYFKVRMLRWKCVIGSPEFIIQGEIVDIASPEEIKTYYSNEIYESGTDIEHSNQNIEFTNDL